MTPTVREKKKYFLQKWVFKRTAKANKDLSVCIFGTKLQLKLVVLTSIRLGHDHREKARLSETRRLRAGRINGWLARPALGATFQYARAALAAMEEGEGNHTQLDRCGRQRRRWRKILIINMSIKAQPGF